MISSDGQLAELQLAIDRFDRATDFNTLNARRSQPNSLTLPLSLPPDTETLLSISFFFFSPDRVARIDRPMAAVSDATVEMVPAVPAASNAVVEARMLRCPRCRLDQRNAEREGVFPYKELFLIWLVTLCSSAWSIVFSQPWLSTFFIKKKAVTNTILMWSNRT